LTDAAGWRAVMLVNVPIVAFALFASLRTGPTAGPAGPGARLDVAGALLATCGTTLLVLGLVGTSTHPWGSARTLCTLGGAALLLVTFVLVEQRSAHPLLRPGLLKGRPVLTANLFCLLLSSGQFAAFYFVSLCLQQVLGYGPTAAGIAFLPFCAGVVAGSVIATRTVAALGTRRLLALGGSLAALGIAGFAVTARTDGTFLTFVLGPSVVTAVGIGMCFVPLGTAATTDVEAAETGMASGLLNSARQVGGSLGLAVLVTVAAQVSGDSGRRADLVSGYASAFWAAAGLLAAGALAALVLLPRDLGAGPAATSGAGTATAPVTGPAGVPVAGPEDLRKHGAGDADPAVPGR
ncbi:MFS transporter, partial [Streptomyces sp. AC154]|uniref:MFS transporter n=1 Tax=Streptomyces sp. AC154 TaxID=3143184 RepID=UPI003F7FF3FB